MAQGEAPVVEFEDQATFEAWLELNFAEQVGIWLKIAKAGKGIPSITYPEALDIALCFGWIDGQRKGLDDRYFLQRFTPRRKRSIWSKINTEKVAKLVAEGRLRPSGHREMELARQDGRWDAAYGGRSTAAIPPEIESDPVAAQALAKLDKTNRFAYIFRIGNAKRADTKARLVQQLRDGHKFY